MAQFLPQGIYFPLEEQLKTLDDDELLDFWEETQYLDKMLSGADSEFLTASLEYEQIIVQELQRRSCRRHTAPC